MIAVSIFLILLLSSGWGLADQKACESDLDISALPAYTPLLQKHLSDLEDYFTCKAAVKEDVQLCSAFPAGSPQKADCQDIYNNYYAMFGKLYPKWPNF